MNSGANMKNVNNFPTGFDKKPWQVADTPTGGPYLQMYRGTGTFCEMRKVLLINLPLYLIVCNYSRINF